MTFEKELVNARTNSSLIPAYASMDEAVYYVLEDNEKNFTEMIKNIGLRELAVYESTGSVLLYEEGSQEKKAADGEKVGFIAQAWSNMRAVFEKIIKMAGDLVTKVLNALRGVVNGSIGAMAKSKAASNAGKGAGKMDALKAAIDKLSDDYIKNIKNQYSYNELKNFENGSTGTIKSALSIVDALLDQGSGSMEDLKINLGVDEINKESIRGVVRGKKEKLTKDVIKKNFEAIYRSVNNAKAVDATLKGYFSSAKKTFDTAMKKSKKGSDKEAVGNLKAIVQSVSVIYSTVLSEYYALLVRNAGIILQLNKIADKPKEDKKQEITPAKPQNPANTKSENKGGQAKDAKTGENVEADVVDKDGNPVNASAIDQEGNPVTESAVDSEIASLFDWSF